MFFLLIKVAGLAHLPEHVFNDWALEPSLVWHEGDESPTGEPHRDAGFNLTLPNHQAWGDAQEYLEEYLEDKAELFHELISLGAVMELHAGMALDGAETVSAPMAFPRSLMASLVDKEIGLSVIAFTGDGSG
jgi:hypothetical protein